ncbi:acetyltransferase (GNAT) family protein [Litorimonas taeanensis]|uniref:Acetyltransferase (GNAT) family protein n=1 Tax=Litorimonas taeanensis TaxID=568099 RepID=A0A420WI98_9PROT|nr:GNAT family N-acetyltransferase [Litorimonas taeanensis]RKQ70751.1 acetyltransferase (GNAT) family protein [Litorimonas taeanensis]
MDKNTRVIIKHNAPDALPRFAALNAQWIKDLHVLEESDKLMIAQPEIYTQNGNHVLSAHLGTEIAGAVALKRHENGEYELTKMAVDSQFRGQGIGQILMENAESFAKNTLGLSRLFLLSNTKNAAALRLYARNGWTVNHEGPHPIYKRANIGMEKQL